MEADVTYDMIVVAAEPDAFRGCKLTAQFSAMLKRSLIFIHRWLGVALCLIFLKLVDRIYAPLTAGLLNPIPADAALPAAKRSRLDRLYQNLADDLLLARHAV